jgi:hypothetical protein
MEVSKPYANAKMAKLAASHSESCKGANKFLLLYDSEKKYIHYVAGDENPDTKLSVLGRYELINGKWRDKSPLGQVHCGGGYTVKEETYR